MKFSTATLTAAIMVVATTVATTASASASDPRTSNTKSAVRGGVPVPVVPTAQRHQQQRKLQNGFDCPVFLKETQMEDHNEDHSNFACLMEDGKFIDIDDTVTPTLVNIGASSGDTVMKVSSGAYMTTELGEGGSKTTKIQIPDAINTVSIELLEETDPRHYKSRRKQRQLIQLQAQQAHQLKAQEAQEAQQPNNQANRNLAPSTPGTLDTLVLRVTGGNNSVMDASPSQLRSDIFTDEFCLATGYAACSKNQLIIAPTNKGTNGVVDVRVTSIPNGSNDDELREQAVSKATQTYGQLTPQFDLVMVCLPPGSGNFVAYAYVNGYLSVYNNFWCTRASAQMHEVGHNLGLGHSNEGEEVYGDQSSMMGYSYDNDDGPKMCFNPAKGYQLGWYERQKLTFDPITNENINKGSVGTSFTLNGVVDYDKDSQQATETNNVPLVSLRLKQYGDTRLSSLNNNFGPDFYIGYNRKSGINSGTIEAGNLVTVHRKESGAPDKYGESNRLAALDVGQSYTINNYKGTQYSVTIKVNSITNSLKDANIEITTSGGNGNGPNPPAPTPAPPTPAPVSAPPAPCNGNGAFVFRIITDPTDEETSWSLRRNINNGNQLSTIIYDINLQGNSIYTYSPFCLNNDQRYTMVVSDANADGRNRRGSYEGYLDGNLIFRSPITNEYSTLTSSTFCIGNCIVPTSSPTKAPTTESPTESPTGFINVSTESPTQNPTKSPQQQQQQCKNVEGYKWKGKNKKNCRWVGKGKPKKIKKKCNKKDKKMGGKIFKYCQATCAKVNKGPCASR